MKNEQWIAEAVERMAAAVSEGRAPHRHDARDILVPLGLLLIEGDKEANGHLGRVRELGKAWGEAWEAAVAGELSLACAEHIHAADPRFLHLPNYDWGYTRDARKRLEARLLAAQAIGLEADEHMIAGVDKADEVLGRHAPSGDTNP